MDTKGTLLTADRGRQADLGQHGIAGVVGRIDGIQRSERWTELHTPGVEPLPDIGAVGAMWMIGKQCVHVIGGGLIVTGGEIQCPQYRTGPALTLAVVVGLN